MKGKGLTILVSLAVFGVSAGSVLGAAPSLESNRFRLRSSDTKVEVVFDKKFGGAITGIYDRNNSGDKNLVDDSQAGAMFQTAFWVIPYHQWLDASKPLPPGCNNTEDMKLDNPTQAGFFADGWMGNPIGVRGTTTINDPNEFIQWENSGKTLHFKTRFIRYDYCFARQAQLSEPACDAAAKTSYLNNPNATCKDLWDTDFYLEQWATFRSDVKYVLELRNKISYIGTEEKGVTSRQLPVIFSANLDKWAYWKDGIKVSASGSVSMNPDKPWVAQVNSRNDSGIGMSMSRNMKLLMGRQMFSGEVGTGNGVGVFFAGQGTVDLPTIGNISGVKIEPSGVNTYYFSQGGSLEWTTYYPIGKIDYIRRLSEGVISYPNGKTLSDGVDGSADIINCIMTTGWARDMKANNAAVTKVRAEIYPVGEYEKKVVKETSVFASRSDLMAAGICTACTYGITFGNLPIGFKDKKLIVDVWGESASGGGIINGTKNMVGPCTNLEPAVVPPTSIPIPTNTPTSTPTRIPTVIPTRVPTVTVVVGDANKDGAVDLADFVIWKREYVTKVGLTADFLKNGVVDLVDFILWKKGYLTR